MHIPFLNLKKITACHAEEIHQAVLNVVDSGHYLKGNETFLFEKEYAQFIGTPHAIACGNGLDALNLIFKALLNLKHLKKGDEVLVPANTFIATILAITHNDLVPVLLEPSWDTLQINENEIENKITSKTRALMLVHLYGRNAATPKMIELCHKHHLLLLEDNAQAQGCCFENQKTGSLGIAAAHSFYPGKNLGALADAGAVTTHDEELARMIQTLGNYGSSQKYVFDWIGQNSRMDEINAAILRIKLKHLHAHNQHRQKIGEFYFEHLKHSQKIILPQKTKPNENVFHLFPIFSNQRDDLQIYLKQNGIETLIHYPIAPHKQKCYAHFQPWQNLNLPITEKIHNEELSLPISPVLTLEEAKYIVDVLNQF